MQGEGHPHGFPLPCVVCVWCVCRGKGGSPFVTGIALRAYPFELGDQEPLGGETAPSRRSKHRRRWSSWGLTLRARCGILRAST